MIRSSPKLQDLVPFIREKSETELFMKAIEIVCLARVWKSLEPIAQKRKQQMMAESLASTYQQVHRLRFHHNFALSWSTFTNLLFDDTVTFFLEGFKGGKTCRRQLR